MHVIIFRFYAQYIHIEISDKLGGGGCYAVAFCWYGSSPQEPMQISLPG